MNYRAEVDGLRAVAVVPVLLFHAGFDAFSGGFVGVDVFFVISGFLITSILIDEIESGTFTIANFYERRARRILPALVLVVAVCSPVAWFMLAPGDLDDYWRSVVAVALFSSNVLFWIESGYFEPEAEMKPLLHTWSLGVEEQFYLLFPPLLWLAWRLGRRRVALLLGATTVASFGLASWLVGVDPAAAFYLLPARAWELGIGAVVALRLSAATRSAAPRLIRNWAAAGGLLLIVVAVVGFDESTPFPGPHALLPTIGTALVLLHGRQDTWVGFLLATRPLVGIGLISYSTYLWHQPLFALTRHGTLGEPAWWVFLTLIMLSLAFAYVSWRYVETPFRRRAFLRRRQVLDVSAAASGGLVALGLVGYLVPGLQLNQMNAAQRAVVARAVPSPERSACHTGGADYRRPDDACRFHASAPRWAVFGDSHGVELAYALGEELKGLGDGVVQFTFSGCAPSHGRVVGDVHCSQWTKEVMEYITRTDSIENVVVTYRIHAHLFGSHERVYPALPDGGTDRERMLTWQSYIGTLRRLVDAGKRVFLVLQAPELPKSVKSLVLRDTRAYRVPGVSTRWWGQRSAYVRDRLSDVPPGVIVVDPAPLFCEVEVCLAVKDGVPLYFDDDHMSVPGARMVAVKIVEAIPVGDHAASSR